MSINLGLIGGGYWGKNLIREFNACGVLHTICEINESVNKLYAEQYPSINITTQWTDILTNTDITAVCISLPADMHYQFAKDALLHNKDVYVEKPITLNVNEAEELIELAKKHNKIIMVGHLLHYHPCIIKMKELIQNEEIGKIKNIISNRLNLGLFRTQENVLWSFAPHDISVILSLCNDKMPDEIQCNGKSVLTKNIHDITNTIMIYKNEDIYININVNWLNPFKEQKLTIIGENGMIVFDDVLENDKLKIFKNYILWNDKTPTPVKTKSISITIDDYESPLLKECKHFIDCCITRKVPITSGEEGLRVLQVLQKSQESLEHDGSIVRIPKSQYYAHDTAIIDNGATIGDDTKIWHFTHVCKTGMVGNNCNIGQGCYIAGILGNNCKVQNGVNLYLGVECEDNVFLAGGVTFTNDRNPRCEYPKHGAYVKTLIKHGSSIGANSTIVCGVVLGKYCFVGAGAVVTHNVPPFAVVVGNPARQIGIIDEKGNITHFEKSRSHKYVDKIKRKLTHMLNSE